MWWTAPAPGDESLIVTMTHIGSRPHADYHNRFGYRQERVSGPRHRCGREGRRQEATATQPGVEVFCVAAALPHWHGGVCHGALLGARVEEARSRGSFDADK